MVAKNRSIGMIVVFAVCIFPDFAIAGKLEGVAVEAAAVATLALMYPFYALGRFTFRKIRYASHDYTVWYGTNRAWNAFSPTRYSNDFSEQISYGSCVVTIPKGHKFGSVGSPWYVRFFQRISAGTDDKLRLDGIRKDTPQNFFAKLRMAHPNIVSEGSGLIYIHGFNVSFAEAAIRAAQLGYDLQVSGPMIFYSWPSRGELGTTAYAADKESIAASEKFLADFLVTVAQNFDGRPMNILVHSMGNLGFIRTLNSAAIQAAKHNGIKFGQIFLAAPDIDQRLFGQLSAVYKEISNRTTLYVSKIDFALEASRAFSESDRVGYTPPITIVDGIDTIEVSDIDVDMLGHGYFASAEPILYDIAHLLRTDQPPGERLRLEARGDLTKRYWMFRN
jgi:esterase/lipase superfamily enzyme